MNKPVMNKPVLIDTGPLVALMYTKDSAHRFCLAELGTLQPPFLTTWAVLTEAAWLLRSSSKALDKLWEAGRQGFFRVPSLPEDVWVRVQRLQKDYATLEPQLADLTLVILAEETTTELIFTLDRRDFSVLRPKNKKPFQIFPG